MGGMADRITAQDVDEAIRIVKEWKAAAYGKGEAALEKTSKVLRVITSLAGRDM